MLEPLLGSKGSEKVLIFITARGEGYAREISQFFSISISTAQNQLDKLEIGGILVRERFLSQYVANLSIRRMLAI